MDTKSRLEHVATALTVTEHSPSAELHAMGLRLLARELDDLDRCTRVRETIEAEEFRASLAVANSAGRGRSISLICAESAERVRRIMGRA